MKLLIGLIFIGMVTLLANILQVIDEKIVLSINEKEYTYLVGEYPLPKDALQVCYVSGKGKALLNNDKKYILSADSSLQCYQVPHKKDGILIRVVDKLGKTYGSEIIEINPSIKSAAGVRSITLSKQLTGDIEVEKEIPFIVIESQYFGKTPIYLRVKNKAGDKIKKYVNMSNKTSLFILSTKDLNDGDIIEVYTRDEKMILKRKIVIVE